MKRSEFLKMFGAGALVTAVAGVAASCKSSTTPTNTVDSHTFTSSTTDSHSHTFVVQKTEVDAPPTTGISRQTGSTNGHTHTFTMTQADLQNVLAGTPVTVTTGDTSAHHHDFTISKWY
ncbi:MAG: hypothetical protein NTZ26_09705 [Candidatus Aminicenantes bacterium]|nr:hypothetical protein [Candidatus Aminicenantes bacterium]